MTIFTYNRTLAFYAVIEDLMMRARKFNCDVIGLTETRRLNSVYDTGEELFLGKCDSKGVGGVGVLANTSVAINIDTFDFKLYLNRTSADEKMWSNSSFDNLRHLRSNIKLREEEVKDF